MERVNPRTTNSVPVRAPALVARGQMQLAFYWSHVRRRFYEMVAARHAPIAAEALARINALFAGADGASEQWGIIASVIETGHLIPRLDVVDVDHIARISTRSRAEPGKIPILFLRFSGRFDSLVSPRPYDDSRIKGVESRSAS